MASRAQPSTACVTDLVISIVSPRYFYSGIRLNPRSLCQTLVPPLQCKSMGIWLNIQQTSTGRKMAH